ncbi:MAG: response regulator [Acidobacteriia bacterium]|jgi:two-component system cell cycle response regulator DivK|nr:response regulator [Terriglobia bacterium]
MAKLLIVEDNEMNRDMLCSRLTRRGYEVVTACDGLEGIEAAQTLQPDLILMDLSLPRLDGWEATRILKSGDATRAIPVVALTAHAMTGDRQKALAAGCDAFDTKPVDIKRLVGIIDQLLHKGN